MCRFHGTGIIALIIIVSLAGAQRAPAQVTLDPAWPENPVTFGGGGWDNAYSVQQTTDGGYIVAGFTASYGAGMRDAYVIKLDSEGRLDLDWDANPTTFGGEWDEQANSVQQTSDGGYIVAGSTTSFGAGWLDVYLIKLDPEGNLDHAWDPNPKTFGGRDSDSADSVQQTADGGYIVAGHTQSFGAGGADVYLIKLDPEGNLDPAWDPNPKTFGGDDGETAYSVEQGHRRRLHRRRVDRFLRRRTRRRLPD